MSVQTHPYAPTASAPVHLLRSDIGINFQRANLRREIIFVATQIKAALATTGQPFEDTNPWQQLTEALPDLAKARIEADNSYPLKFVARILENVICEPRERGLVCAMFLASFLEEETEKPHTVAGRDALQVAAALLPLLFQIEEHCAGPDLSV